MNGVEVLMMVIREVLIVLEMCHVQGNLYLGKGIWR